MESNQAKLLNDPYSWLTEEVAAARERIEPYTQVTSLLHSPCYSRLTGANVFFKCENLQTTGSFKIRGATNKLLSLDAKKIREGVVSASTGNHGKAVARTSNLINVPCTIFAPENTEPNKLDAIQADGATIQIIGSDCIESEAAAREYAHRNSVDYIPPYNDPDIVAGQGTVGLEICEQLDSVDAVIASLGGGGLISGIGGYLKNRFPRCQVIGCSPENSKVMIQSLDAGQILESPSKETLSDGTAGGVEKGSITFELCQKIIDETASVSETEIAASLIQFMDWHGMLIEGAAAVAIAALLKSKHQLQGKNVVVVLCGANISTKRLGEVINLERQDG